MTCHVGREVLDPSDSHIPEGISVASGSQVRFAKVTYHGSREGQVQGHLAMSNEPGYYQLLKNPSPPPPQIFPYKNQYRDDHVFSFLEVLKQMVGYDLVFALACSG